MPSASPPITWHTAFHTDLGWMAMAGSGEAVVRLVFGYESAAAARHAMALECPRPAQPPAWSHCLQARLQDYTAGCPVEFDDIRVSVGGLSPFGEKVYAALRRVRYGQVVSYGVLADQAGSPRAGRAVGNLMAANPIPLVIPCHRVVCRGGRIGHFSAPGGDATKRRLLEMEHLAQTSSER